VGRAELVARSRSLNETQERRYREYLARRLGREPVQRILGYAYFRNLKLRLSKETLIPRPDTESVVGVALESIDRRGPGVAVLDLGTGSGAIALSIAQERPYCRVLATDESGAALRTARTNAAGAGVEVEFRRADVARGLEDLRGSIDVLVSNPPYVRSGDLRHLAPEVRDWEPLAALDGGPDGLDFYRRIFAEVPPLLAGGADVVLETGDGQAEAVLELGRRAGFEPLEVRPDLAGSPRAVVLRWVRGPS
jgi:release factor glutamine methyltransferase